MSTKTSADPSVPEYLDTVDLREWLGDWDPDAFDLEAVRHVFDG